ncbi:MAG TPA: hypothetical protein VGA52_06615 [Anaerolineales bacterium]|jgi:hypothetical protein
MKRILMSLALVAVLALALPLGALAQGGTEDGRVVLGGSYTLEAGQTMEGDLVVLGGNVTLEEGSSVDGSMLVMGGNAVSAATITGGVTVFGGNINLLGAAVVQGDIISFGGNVVQSPGAQVQGDIVDEDGFDFRFLPRVDRVVPRWEMSWSPILSILWFIFRTLMLAALAVLIVMFWPTPTERTADAIVANPLATGGLGLLTFLVAPLLLGLLLITILLSPVSLIGFVVLIVAAVFGWIAVGLEVGRRMATALNWELHAAAAAGLGTLLLTFVIGGIGLIPCVGWIAPFLVASIGLGGVILTRFGSREYVMLEPAASGSSIKRAKSDE